VLELLALGVEHDRSRLRVGLDREPLLVPPDCLGLLDERSAESCERTCRGRQFVWGLLILVEAQDHPAMTVAAGSELELVVRGAT
jgi:hypothetical protein